MTSRRAYTLPDMLLAVPIVSSARPLRGPHSPARSGLVLILGVFFVAACARIDIPMVPVPMSLQTFAVLLIGGLAGWRLGGGVLILYLLSGALGLPVFADGAAGLGHLIGVTAGYLFGFLFSAILVGFLAERGWTSKLWRSTLAMILGHALILGLGAVWLGFQTDWGTAYEGGFRPFLLGALAKSLLAASTISIWRRITNKRSHPRPRTNRQSPGP